MSEFKKRIITLVLGIISGLVLCEIAMHLGKMVFVFLQERDNAAGSGDNIYRVLCVGDSTTALGGKHSWPRQLEKVMNQRIREVKNTSGNVNFSGVAVINKGRVASDSGYVAENLSKFIDKYKPHTIVMMLGINENGVMMYRGIPDAGSFWFKNIKIYKLARVLWHHTIRKYKQKPLKADDMYKKDYTGNNFRNIAYIAKKRKVKLVVMQYPLLSLKPLKNMFAGEEEIDFVDNENVFRQALEKGKFEDYFVDRFAGSFGHCTPKGNHLIAENVAEVLFKKF